MNGPDTAIRIGRLLVIWAFSLAATAGAGSLSASDIHELFAQGKDAFRQADELVSTDPDQARALYRKAAMRFERIVKQGGIHNGKLYYNIGNAYFRMEDIGRAILNYRRAEQYTPNDVLLQENLKYARARRLDRIEEEQRTKVLKTVFFWHYDLSTRARAITFAVCFASVWILAAIRLLIARGPLVWALIISAILSLLLLGSLLTETVRLRTDKPGVIVGRQVVARKGDSDTYEKSFTEPLHAGTEFKLIESRGDWFQIQLCDRARCWVPAKDSELVR